MLATQEAPRLSLLGGRDHQLALVSGDETLTYAQLADRVTRRRLELGAVRRLVMLQASNTIESIVTYLAALEGAHPLMLVAPGDDESTVRHRSALIERFTPDVLADGAATGTVLDELRDGTVHSFDAELALLVSTSGSTGSPKLVRLSAENLMSNAHAIADYLRLMPSDRAPTTLPMHYCYGLSVINSHLVAGASIVLTNRSVADDAFWAEAEQNRITSLAGVPYTYEMLDAGGFTKRLPSSIRYLTQAGGRLAPDAVRRFARLGEQRGFEFFVMYGQTEATARMAYVPAALAERAADSIGQAIPGGRLRVDAEPGAETGELVYEGPNVMLGCAERPRDFALGRTVHELRTGDLARQRDDGLFEIVGRLNRFVKVFGLRIDLDAVQTLLADHGIEARAASVDERLLIFVTAERLRGRARRRAAELLGIPARSISVYAVAEFPHTSSGKPDFAALVRFAARADTVDTPADATAHRVDTASPHSHDPLAVTAEAIRDLFIDLLGRPDATVDDSFAGLGGDSLSYVEVSLRLEDLLEQLPRDWPAASARQLAAQNEPAPAALDETAASMALASTRVGSTRRRRLLPHVETPAVLRAIAIVLIVGTHADLFGMQGGAHLLLAIAGYNLARFQLAQVMGTTRVRRLMSSIGQIAIPAAIWIAAVALISGKYTWTTALLANNLVPSDGRWNEQWQFWFLEAMIWAMLGLAAIFAVRPIDRLERRHPWAFAVALLGVTLGIRLALTGIEALHTDRYAAAIVLWCVALGWVVARADTTLKRVTVSIAAVVATAGFFGEPLREGVVILGVLVLIWAPQIRMPRPLIPFVRLLAGSSLFIYLTHWVVYPVWETRAPLIGTLLSFAVGIFSWHAYRFATRLLAARRTERRQRTAANAARGASVSAG